MCDIREYETEEELLAAVRSEAACKRFFLTSLMNPAFHWFFTEGQDALMQELYIPGVSSLLNGIEASVRVTMAQLVEDYDGKLVLSNYQLLSNTLLRQARDAGLPIQKLAFPGEDDFNDVLERKDKSVAVVQLRHDVCHGNILEFIQRMEFENIEYFTPECLQEIAAVLLTFPTSGPNRLRNFAILTGGAPRESQFLKFQKIPYSSFFQWLGADNRHRNR